MRVFCIENVWVGKEYGFLAGVILINIEVNFLA